MLAALACQLFECTIEVDPPALGETWPRDASWTRVGLPHRVPSKPLLQNLHLSVSKPSALSPHCACSVTQSCPTPLRPHGL